MTRRVFGVILLVAGCVTGSAGRAATDERVLVGWGLGTKNAEKIIADAAAVGFDALITGSNDPEFLAKAVKVAETHGIRLFACITPMSHVKRLWPERYPEEPVPWQVISKEEEAAATFIGAGKNKFIIPYQWGGEPEMMHEVMLQPILCFTHPDAVNLFKPLIDTLVTVPGLAGIAFDGFGYRNYYGCRCERCHARLNAYLAKHRDVSPNDAAKAFFREVLVEMVNGLADYARSKKPAIKTTIHIWPVYAPDPLYGNRLDVDYCGQTTAWYTLWPQEKIAAYSRIVCEKANTYHARPTGVGMIGYYDAPGRFPVKNAARVEMELRAMFENGCRRVQVCGATDVIDNPPVAEVFKRYFHQPPKRDTDRKPFNALGPWRRKGR